MEKSSSISENLELFMERFPLLGLGICTAPRESIDPGKAEVFYFYGLNSSVYLECRDWLQGDKQLVFLESDLQVIHSFLHDPLAHEILSNPNIHIETPSNIEALASRFPVKRIEIDGLKSKKGLKKLRLELLRKTTLAHALHMDRLHGYQPFHNFLNNLKLLPRSFYANGLKGAFQNTPAVICGAGPSLEPTIDLLRGLENRALIIAGGSTLAALSSKGVMPHFGMAIDPNLEEYRRMKNSFAFEVPLLYSTRVHPDIFQTCSGPFGYMRSGIGGLLELWIEEELGLTEPLLGEFLSSETISVTGICIAFAQFLGCNPILLNGIDMAYTGGRRYASGVDGHEELFFEEIDREKSASDRIVRKKGVYSAVRWIMESASISHFAQKHKEIQFINTTSGGIGFEGIEYVPLSEAVRDFKEQNLREEVLEKVHQSLMPKDTKEILDTKIEEMRLSLLRLIEHLEVLSGEKKGSGALAEMELQEEIAALYLFYDIRQILKPGPLFWKEWLELSRKYEKMFICE